MPRSVSARAIALADVMPSERSCDNTGARSVARCAALHTGIALHYGEVGYGNIGSGQRLDFTVIGSDVNLVSRIQTVCSTSGHPLLMSERFATLLDPETTIEIGQHKLRGFIEPAKLYSLRDGFAGRASQIL